MLPGIQGQGPGWPAAPAEETSPAIKLRGLHQCTCGHPLERRSKGGRGDILALSFESLPTRGHGQGRENAKLYFPWPEASAEGRVVDHTICIVPCLPHSPDSQVIIAIFPLFAYPHHQITTRMLASVDSE